MCKNVGPFRYARTVATVQVLPERGSKGVRSKRRQHPLQEECEWKLPQKYRKATLKVNRIHKTPLELAPAEQCPLIVYFLELNISWLLIVVDCCLWFAANSIGIPVQHPRSPSSDMNCVSSFLTFLPQIYSSISYWFPVVIIHSIRLPQIN